MIARVFLLLVVLGGGAASEALACGNKFLVPSRGTRFGPPPVAREQADILVYAAADSSLSEALGEISLGSVLVEAGYRPVTVARAEELEAALASRDWDVVVADLHDSREVQARLPSGGGARLLSVAYRADDRELALAERELDQVIEAPLKRRRFLQVLDYTVAMITLAR